MAGTRRETLARLLGAGMIATASRAFTPTSALASEPLPIPDRPLLLLRSINHEFHDGTRLSVLRSWTVEFARVENGIDVLGEAGEVAVDASPQLSALAELEYSRNTADLWPVRLSAGGLILAAGDGDGSGGSPDRPASAAVLERLPDDLFFPSLGPIRSVQAMELPGGLMGEFVVEYAASGVPNKGWLDRAQRQVTTRIGSTRESALERWLMAEL